MNSDKFIGKYCVVTTKHRGVFCGVLESRVREGDRLEVTISDSRLCVSWSSKTKGFVGLAVTGPLSGSRVSKGAPLQELVDITSITLCTQEAIDLWKEEPWS